MTALRRKLARDLARLRAQGVTIALVVACGVASFVAMRSAYDSLVAARDAYYADRRFADVFVRIERAPEPVAARLEAIRGVARAHTRLVEDVTLPMPGLPDLAVGRVVSLPPAGQPPLNALRIRRGRLPEPGRADEVAVLESFAVAHGLRPGDAIPAVMNGSRRELRVVGVAVSPEFVFALSGGSMVQDDRRFAVLWMDRDAVAPVFRREGTFNDALLSLQPGASAARVEAEARRALEPYGVIAVTARDRQPSHRALDGELSQLRQFALISPVIFLGVAAFLVNVVLARLLRLQRGQVATLKALGYRQREVAAHYTQLVAVVVAAGAALGVGLGVALGRGMLALYAPYFRFASLTYRLAPASVAASVAVSVGAGLLGALRAVARAVKLPPAEAMRPEAPPVYRRTLAERAGLLALLAPAGKMVARELLRRPLRAALSCLGVALATAVAVTARFAHDAMDALVAQQFEHAQREDVEVTFRRPLPAAVAREVAHLPGVLEVQVARVVPVRVHADQRVRDAAVFGYPRADVPLRRPAVWPVRDVALPADGVAVSEMLARVLRVRVGERVTLEVLEGDRRRVDARVAGLVPDVAGLAVHAPLATVDRLLGQEPRVTSALVRLDPREQGAFDARLRELSQVAAVSRRREVLAQFRRQAEHVSVTTAVLTLFGAVIAFGVVYNQARVALSTRSRELASMRILGFTRREVSAVLLGELAAYVAIGTPAGCALGRVLAGAILATVDPETYRMPLYVSAQTYAFAATVTLLAALASASLVRRKVDRMDLVAVLKTRE